MTKATSRLLLFLASVLLVSCSSSPSETGSARFAVSVRQELAASITRVSVTSSAADIPSVTVDLTNIDGVWGGIIGNIPAGTNRSFLAQAFDSSGTKLFEGSASGITISANQSTVVAITLQEVAAPPPFQNEAPIIDSLVASSTTVAQGGSITLQATAHDPNTGDSLTYAWSSTAGTFSSAAAASTSWTAPLTTGIKKLTVTVTDSGGLSSSIDLAVNVSSSVTDGDAQLSITFNSSPRVVSVIASPTQIAVGQTTAVSVSASDPDGDSLSYSWSATCTGSWANATSRSAQFMPLALPAKACNNCSLTVSVSDGHGGQTTGTVALCVGNTPPINHFPPVIVRSYRSSDMASAGQVLTYEVVANDPEGSALTFAWAANTGALGTTASTATSSGITWTAPSCASRTPTITATVTNAFNMTVTRSFEVTGLPTCSTWLHAGTMKSARRFPSVTLLPSGNVLVVGGASNYDGDLATAEVWDAVSGTWVTTGSVASPRRSQTATLLPNGKVLVAGGWSNNDIGKALTEAEVYDPASGTWMGTGSMTLPRVWHMATQLPDGKVLVSGGISLKNSSTTAEVYDPTSGTWAATGAMLSPHIQHTATLLPNRKVLVAGGYGLDDLGGLDAAELYDPATGTWSPTSSMNSGRQSHTATLLLNGKVLVTGGEDADLNTLATAEIYDPATGTWAVTGSMTSARSFHTATLLPDGKILVAGGYDSNNTATKTAEVYDPLSGNWTTSASMTFDRGGHGAPLLPNGKVLVVGGDGPGVAELYTP